MNYDRYRQTLGKRFAYRPSDAPPCPRVVVGRACLMGQSARVPCLCQQFQDLLDHRYTWIDGARRVVVTADPYEFTLARLTQFKTATTEQGLQIAVSVFPGVWYPGATTLLVFRSGLFDDEE
jgi:hypothetical protein